MFPRAFTLFCLLIVTSGDLFAPLPCATHNGVAVSDGTAALSLAAAFERNGSLAHARACYLHAYSSAGSGEGLSGAQRSQLALLEVRDGGPKDARFSATWRSLMQLMENKSIMSAVELDHLASAFDVYFLHAQLACCAELTSFALRSLRRALALRTSTEGYELLARIALGRGNAAEAARSVATARRLQDPHLGPAARAPALLLHLQAAMAARVPAHSGALAGRASTALSATMEAGAAAVDASDDEGGEDDVEVDEENAAGALDLDSVWRDVRALVGGRLARLGVQLPPDDPLSAAVPSAAPPAFVTLANAAAGGKRGARSRVAVAPAAGSAVLSGAGAWLTPLGAAAAASPGWLDGWMSVATPAAAATFQTKGYATLRGLLPAPYSEALLRRHIELFLSGTPDGDAPRKEVDTPQRRHTLWNEELSMYVALRLLPAIEAIAGQRLSSTYTFSIAYERGGVLHPHVDRAQNAISLSLTLGRQPSHLPPWPLYVSPRGLGEDAGIPVLMHHNDALLYRGENHTHFRRPQECEGESACSTLQVIFGFRDTHADHCNSQ